MPNLQGRHFATPDSGLYLKESTLQMLVSWQTLYTTIIQRLSDRKMV
jgi:hypothetical protein